MTTPNTCTCGHVEDFARTDYVYRAVKTLSGPRVTFFCSEDCAARGGVMRCDCEPYIQYGACVHTV